MNVRLKRNFVFSTAMVYQDRFLINHYNVVLHMVTATEDQDHQNIAYERMKFWMHEIMSEAVMINQDNPLLSAYLATKQRLIILPEDPVDQIVGMMLYCKLNAIAEGNLLITEVELSSVHGSEMVYLHSDEESLGPFADPGWWNDESPVWADTSAKKKGNKVINLEPMPKWKNLGLDWSNDKDEEETPADDAKVLFAKFDKDANK